MILLHALPVVNGIVGVAPEAAGQLHLRRTSRAAGRRYIAARMIDADGQGRREAHEKR